MFLMRARTFRFALETRVCLCLFVYVTHLKRDSFSRSITLLAFGQGRIATVRTTFCVCIGYAMVCLWYVMLLMYVHFKLLRGIIERCVLRINCYMKRNFQYRFPSTRLHDTNL